MNKKILFAGLALAMTVGMCSCGAKVSYDFELSEYLNLSEYNGIEITQSEIDEAYNETIESLKAQYTTTEEITDRAIKEGDIVSVNYILKSGETQLEKQDNYSVTVGSDKVKFEDALIGSKKSDVVTMDITLPDDYSNADYAGTEAKYEITIGTITVENVPEIDDAFIEENLDGAYESAEDFLAQTLEATKKNIAWDKVISESKVIKYPEENIKAYYDNYTEYYLNMYQSYANTTGYTIQEIYSMFGTSAAGIYEQAASTARSDVKNDLVVLMIAEKEGITVDDVTYAEEIEKKYADYGYESAKKMEKTIGRDAVERMILSEKVVELITENAVIK